MVRQRNVVVKDPLNHLRVLMSIVLHAKIQDTEHFVSAPCLEQEFAMARLRWVSATDGLLGEM